MKKRKVLPSPRRRVPCYRVFEPVVVGVSVWVREVHSQEKEAQRRQAQGESAHRPGEPSGSATPQPTDYLTLFSCPFCHNPTLQNLRLPSVTTTVAKFVFTQRESTFPRFN
jgi:hypothetical protein